jgi:hypothetical protein
MVNPIKDVSFHWADYLVFSATLVISAAIGLGYSIKQRKATAQEVHSMIAKTVYYNSKLFDDRHLYEFIVFSVSSLWLAF